MSHRKQLQGIQNWSAYIVNPTMSAGVEILKIIEGKGVCTYLSSLLACSVLSILQSSTLQVSSTSPFSIEPLTVADTIKQLNSKKKKKKKNEF